MLKQCTRGSCSHRKQFEGIFLLFTAALQHRLNIAIAKSKKANQLTARPNRAQQPFGSSCEKNQQTVPRLLQRFQQCVGRRLRHGLGGFDHHHSPLGFHGLTCQKPTHTSNLL